MYKENRIRANRSSPKLRFWFEMPGVNVTFTKIQLNFNTIVNRHSGVKTHIDYTIKKNV